jgi:CHAD domain-containing protein
MGERRCVQVGHQMRLALRRIAKEERSAELGPRACLQSELGVAARRQQCHLVRRKVEESDTCTQAWEKLPEAEERRISGLLNRLRPENGAVDLSQQAQSLATPVGIMQLLHFDDWNQVASSGAL